MMKNLHFSHYALIKLNLNKISYSTVISDKETIRGRYKNSTVLKRYFATHYRKIKETSCEWCQWKFLCWKYWKFNIVITLFLRDGRCPISGDHNVTYYLDKFADREIGQLIVICRYKVNGCTWSDRLKFLEVSFVEFLL